MLHIGLCFFVAVSREPVAVAAAIAVRVAPGPADPVNASSLLKPEAVRITSGAEHIATFQPIGRRTHGRPARPLSRNSTESEPA